MNIPKHTPDYLLIGHMTADLVPDGRVPGGTVSYAARTAAAFGLRVGLLTSAAHGEPLLETLTPYADIVSLPARETTTYENIYTPDGRVQYVRGVAAPIRPADIPTIFRGAKLVHLAPIADEFDPLIAREFPGALVLLTLQGLLRRWDADGRVHFKHGFNAKSLRHVDIVVFSEEDIREAPEMEAEIAGAAKHVIVTRAERGGTLYTNGTPTAYDTPSVEVVNPTGAGDVFAAGVLASLPALRGDLRAALHVGARLGATCVTRPDLDGTPTPQEARAALALAESILDEPR